MRKPFIAANWKMHKTREEARNFMKDFRGKVEGVEKVEIGLGPTFTALDVVDEEREGTDIKLLAQNMYHEAEGAFTGEIAPPMLKELRCDYVIIGHSERRNVFGEEDELLNKKLPVVFENGMKPVLCIGESQGERAAGETEAVLERQLTADLEGLSGDLVGQMVIAYEPIWAIGTGESASPQDAQEGCQFVRDTVTELFDQEAAEAVRIQYGGSIKPYNAEELMGQPDIDGGLVGSASLEPESFAQIIEETEKLY